MIFLELFLLTAGFYGVVFLSFRFIKWIMVAIYVLIGDKESLHDFGDLCEPDDWDQPPRNWKQNGWRDQHWR